MRRLSALLPAACIALGACLGDPAEPIIGATVSALDDTVVATRVVRDEVEWVEFTVPFRVDNTGNVDLLVQRCLSQVEVRDGQTWAIAWAPPCPTSEVLLTIPGGATRDFEFPVSAPIVAAAPERWRHDSVPGTYRLSPVIAAALSNFAATRVPTNSFVVIDGTAGGVVTNPFRLTTP